jgi:hypothetical protein
MTDHGAPPQGGNILRYQGTAMQALGILAGLAGCFAVFDGLVLLLSTPKSGGLPIAGFFLTSAVLFLFSYSALLWRLGSGVRRQRTNLQTRRFALAVAQLIILGALLVAVGRGPQGRALLWGFDTLLAILLTLALLGTVLAIPWPGKLRTASPPEAAHSGLHLRTIWPLWGWHLVACLSLIGSLGFLESRPLPSSRTAGDSTAQQRVQGDVIRP